ncbi:MAG TPA: hypothetical protein VM925_26890 [Labilithrix sp.]|jgi:hypothetical protein|nr:hypothetical protein [Labilithrix sp.]
MSISRAPIVAVVLVTTSAAFAACSSDPASVDAAIEAGVLEAGADVEVAPPVDAGAGVDAVVHDAGDPGALIEKDAGQKIDASGCQPNDCDCDNDGYNDLQKTGCADAGGEEDCDDSDSRTRPNQSFLEIPGEVLNGNWNCKNGVEKLFATNVSCGLLALGACDGIQGFSGDPACGSEGEYVFCKSTLVLCGIGSTTTRKQACK